MVAYRISDAYDYWLVYKHECLAMTQGIAVTNTMLVATVVLLRYT